MITESLTTQMITQLPCLPSCSPHLPPRSHLKCQPLGRCQPSCREPCSKCTVFPGLSSAVSPSLPLWLIAPHLQPLTLCSLSVPWPKVSSRVQAFLSPPFGNGARQPMVLQFSHCYKGHQMCPKKPGWVFPNMGPGRRPLRSVPMTRHTGDKRAPGQLKEWPWQVQSDLQEKQPPRPCWQPRG